MSICLLAIYLDMLFYKATTHVFAHVFCSLSSFYKYIYGGYLYPGSVLFLIFLHKVSNSEHVGVHHYPSLSIDIYFSYFVACFSHLQWYLPINLYCGNVAGFSNRETGTENISRKQDLLILALAQQILSQRLSPDCK